MSADAPRTEIVQMTPEQEKSRRARNVAIALAIVALVVLFYVVTIAKLGLGVLNKGAW
jgi:hypothetical protein